MLSISEDSSTATSSTDPTPGMSVNAWVAAGKGKGKWPPMSDAEVQEFWAAKGKGKKGRPHAGGDESDEEGDDERNDEREGGLQEEGEEEEPLTPSSSSPRRILTDPRNQRIAEAIWSGRFAWGDIDESTWESGDAGDQSLPRIPEEELVIGDGEAPTSTATATATATETAPSTFATGGSTSMPSSATTQVTGTPSTTLAPSSPAPEPLPTTSTTSVAEVMGIANEMPNDEQNGGLDESPEALSVPAGHDSMVEPVRDEGVGTNLPVPAEAEPSEEEEGEGGDGSGIPLEVQHEWRVAANLPGADQPAEPAPEGTLDPLPVASSTTSEAAHPGEDRDETGADPGEDREEETLPHPRIHRDPQHEAPPGDRRSASRSRSPITPPAAQPKRMPRSLSSPSTTAVAVRINGNLVGWFLYREPETRQDYAAMVLRVVLQAQAFACWSHGGRYWETDLTSTAYFQSLQIDFEAEDDCDGCLAVIVERLQRLPEHLIGGVCAPSSWEEEEVRIKVMPQFLSRSLQFDFQLPVPSREDLQVLELSHWSQLKLDFVVGGLDSCGTNTVTYGLAQADEIAFTMEDEDPFFFRHDSLLPYRHEVESFNFQWLGKAIRGWPGLCGLRHPGLFHSHRVRLALASIPRLKMILVLCDPLSRFEKRFWLQNQCQVNVHAIPREGRCFWSAKAALEEPHLLQQVAFSRHLEELQRLMGPERLRAVHQASFRQSFAEVFQRLVEFLGGQRPVSFKPHRHNHHGGHRSDLCRNASLVSDLQALLGSEYRAVEELLQSHGGGALAASHALRPSGGSGRAVTSSSPLGDPCAAVKEASRRCVGSFRYRALLVMAESMSSRQTPWCTIFLVVSTVLFNALVLVGNKWTADALSEIGVSTKGWSHVGTGIASALKSEIDVVMSNVSVTLLNSLDHVMAAQGNLEMVLSMVGNETDKAIAKQPELLLLQEHGPEKGLALLQEVHGKNQWLGYMSW
eukprot:s495_g7.t2